MICSKWLYVLTILLYDMICCMIWYRMIWYVIWYDMPYDMICRMIWRRMIWYVVWYDVVWYDVVWYDMTYDMTSYDMTSYEMTSYDMICPILHDDIYCMMSIFSTHIISYFQTAQDQGICDRVWGWYDEPRADGGSVQQRSFPRWSDVNRAIGMSYHIISQTWWYGTLWHDMIYFPLWHFVRYGMIWCDMVILMLLKLLHYMLQIA